jgi:hypothetical protein
MREVFEYKKGYWYPHLSPAEKAIWERFLFQYPQAYDSVQYDFHVGSPPPFNTLTDEGEDWEQDKLYRRRIDVIGRVGSQQDIIEVKRRATTSTIGQVEGYRDLFMRDEEPLGAVKMVIVTEEADKDVEYLCKQKGVELIIV